MLVAIDGTAASGKGTIARLLANRYGMKYLDTGKIYRLITLKAIDKGINPDNTNDLISIVSEVNEDDLSNPELESRRISNNTPLYAKSAILRSAILDFQRSFARSPEGAVLDGRDIGTVVLPFAEIKIFVDADPATRAQRRARELRSKGVDVTDDEIFMELIERDRTDREREVAPLKRAKGSILLDTTSLSISDAFKIASDIVDQCKENRCSIK